MLNGGSEADRSLSDDRRLHKERKSAGSNYTTTVPLKRTRVSVLPWRPPGLSQARLLKLNGVQSSAVHPAGLVARKISDERKSSHKHHDDKDAIRTFPAGSSMASHTTRAAGTTSMQMHSGQTQHGKDPTLSIKRKIQKNIGNRESSVPIKKNITPKNAGLIDTPLPIQGRVNQEAAFHKDCAIPVQKRVILKTAVTKDAPVPIKSRGIQETVGPRHSTVTSHTRVIQKNLGRKDTALPIQREGIQKIGPPEDRSVLKTGKRIKKTLAPQVPAPSFRRNGSTKTSVPQQVSDKKTKKTQTRAKPSSEVNDPIYIQCDDAINKYIYGWGEECESVGQNCIFCDKDFSFAPRDDDKYKYDDEFKYVDSPELCMLPAVDILPCGHAFHSECLLQLAVTEEQSSDHPPCFICLSMA